MHKKRRSILAVLITLSIALSSFPVGVAYADEGGPDSVDSKPDRTPNPDLAEKCGIDVILVLDESGSIQTAGAIGQVRDAARTFANSLKDTGSHMAVIEFNYLGRPVLGGGYNSVTSSWVSGDFEDYISGNAPVNYDPSDYSTWRRGTNWDDALEEVNAVASAAPLVVFVTDGVPTMFNANRTGDEPPPDPKVYQSQDHYYHGIDPNDVRGLHGQITSTQGLWRAMQEANAIKAAGSHILAVGVGDALEPALKDITGDDVSPPDTFNIKTTDVTIGTFATLESQLREIALDLCGNSISAVKKDNDTGELVSGWPFTFHVSVADSGPAGSCSSNTAFNWEPNPPGGTNDRTESTGANGEAANVQWIQDDDDNYACFTITETLAAPYSDFMEASCTIEAKDVPATSLTINTDTTNSPNITISGVIPGNYVLPVVKCEFVNDNPTLVDLVSFTAQANAVMSRQGN